MLIYFLQAFEKIKDDPEFAVDGCHYVIIREDRYQQYLDFLRQHFLKDEPLSANVSSLDFWDIELEPFWLQQVPIHTNTINCYIRVVWKTGASTAPF